MTHTTLVLLVKGTPIARVLLGYKKTGFGQGKYTGIGGKVEPGETIQETAVREIFEETTVTVSQHNLIDAGYLTFYFPARPEWNLTSQIFLGREWVGHPQESQEIRPKWFDTNHLPFDTMWDDAIYWYPQVLQTQYIKAVFTFSDDCETVATYHIDP